ncbi:MAG: hypothetical protein Q9191_005316 [Dirinaria sp. TL-2023a]
MRPFVKPEQLFSVTIICDAGNSLIGMSQNGHINDGARRIVRLNQDMIKLVICASYLSAVRWCSGDRAWASMRFKATPQPVARFASATRESHDKASDNYGGEDLPVQVVQSCLLKAMTWVAQQASVESDAPMNYKTFRQKPILLKIFPRKAMSRSTCAKILAAWSEFITNERRAFVTQMTITDGDSGFLGYMEILNEASGSDVSAAFNASSVQLVKPGDDAANLISDGSNTNNSLTANRPPNEYKVRLPETTYVRLQMNNYGQDLPASDFLAVLLDIQMTVIQHIIISGGSSYVGEVQRWNAGGVKFQIVPLRMTWLTLAQLVEAIHSKVVEPFGTFEFEFDVTYNGPRGSNKLGVGFCRQQQH